MKPIVFLGTSLESIRNFPPSVKREAGYELDKVQRGNQPNDWKAMPNIEARRCRDRVCIEGIEMSKKEFDSVWDAIEDDPVKREIYKLRSELIDLITQHIKANNLKQREVAALLGISQPRVSTLMKGDFESFRLDTLVGFALKCGHTVSIDAA